VHHRHRLPVILSQVHRHRGPGREGQHADAAPDRQGATALVPGPGTRFAGAGVAPALPSTTAGGWPGTSRGLVLLEGAELGVDDHLEHGPVLGVALHPARLQPQPTAGFGGRVSGHLMGSGGIEHRVSQHVPLGIGHDLLRPKGQGDHRPGVHGRAHEATSPAGSSCDWWPTTSQAPECFSR
jgi:hypothetical protein